MAYDYIGIYLYIERETALLKIKSLKPLESQIFLLLGVPEMLFMPRLVSGRKPCGAVVLHNGHSVPVIWLQILKRAA